MYVYVKNCFKNTLKFFEFHITLGNQERNISDNTKYCDGQVKHAQLYVVYQGEDLRNIDETMDSKKTGIRGRKDKVNGMCCFNKRQ